MLHKDLAKARTAPDAEEPTANSLQLTADGARKRKSGLSKED
jgi:hypothetical protein